MKCAIHQPNFFPWLGYFDKIAKSDVFVFLDDVQIVKTGSSWVNRSKLNCFGKEKCFTCPIKRPNGVVKIKDVEFADQNWQLDFFNTIDSYYKKYPNYDECKAFLLDIFGGVNTSNLCEFNIHVIKALCVHLKLDTKFILLSDLNISTSSTQLLIDICKKTGSDVYFCGGGASGYQEDAKFAEAKIGLMYQNFMPTPYGNKDKFIPGLSVIDYLMSDSNVF